MKKYILIIIAFAAHTALAVTIATISTGTQVISSGNVQVIFGDGSFINNGIYNNAAGATVFNGSVAMSGTGTTTTYQLTVNNSAATSVLNSPLLIVNNVTMSGGVLNANGDLTLLSTVTGTARIAAITGGSITGNVNVQQYIPGGRRAFRFLGHPFSSSIPISQLENNIDITGSGGGANGFTGTYTNNPSAFWYNPLTGNGSTTNDSTGWTPFTSTNGSGNNAWNAKEGIRVLVRGSQGQGLNGVPYTPSAATININGTVNQGAITETLRKGTNSGYNILSNPYPSPTDIGTVIGSATNLSGSGYYVWDANQQTAGAYVVHNITGGAYIIPANTSFIVNTAIDNNTLSFTESNKASAATSPLLKATTANNFVSLHLYDSAGNSWDRLYLSFNTDAAATIEHADARKLHNTDLDFYSYSADSQKLCIDARPFVNNEIIPLGIATSKPQQFTIIADEYNVPAGGELFLHDKYLGIYQPLSEGAAYSFVITGDAASQGDNRFELGMTGGIATAVNNITNTNIGLEVTILPNPATEQVTVNYNADKAQPATLNLISLTGKKMVTKDLGITQKGSVTLPLQNLAAGIYIVNLTYGNQTTSRQLVKQ